MSIKKSLANVLMKSAKTTITKNTASFGVGYGIEKIPESLKKTR